MDSAWTTVHVRQGIAGAAAGTADVIFPTFGGGDNAIDVPALQVRVRNGDLRIAMPTPRDTLVLVGRLTGDTIAGTYRLGKAKGTFGLTRWTYLAIDSLARYYGAYRVSPDRVISIFRGWGHARTLNYVDYESGEVGTLWPASDREFFGGTGLAVSFPVSLRVSFEPDGLRWRPAGGTALTARRIPFDETEVTFRNGDISLGGTLIAPTGPGPHPAIIVIPGDYGTNRDQLRMWAHNFVAAGVAALVFDARGGGASGGPVNSSSFDELAGDVLAALHALAKQDDIDSTAIGVFGFSNSAFTASLAAARSERVAFLIMQSFVGVVPWRQESWRAETQLRVDGFPDSVVRLGAEFMRMKYEVARTGRGWHALQERMARAQGDRWLAYTSPPNSIERLQQVYDLVMTYDPIPALTRVNVPVLAFWGDRDTYLPVPETIANVERALRQAGHGDHTIRVFAGTSHSILETSSGTPSSGGTEHRFPPAVWELQRDWLLARVAVR